MNNSTETSPAEELKQLRKAAGYTQRTFSVAVAVDKSCVAHWEGGNAIPGRESAIKIKALLGSFPNFKNKDLSTSPWFLYFARQPTGRIKIGISSNVEKRIYALEVNSGYPTTLIKKWEYPTRKEAAAVETYLKNHFADKNTLGEWFEGIKVPARRIDLECERAA